jgi:uncharacterized membrane protein YdbT with pleckstrin-like domain
MAYYRKVLQPDETVRYVAALHWTIYRHAILFVVLSLAAALGATQVAGGPPRRAILAAAALLLLLAVMSYLRAWFRQKTTEIVITDKRIMHKRGFIGRRTEEMNISKVETVDVDQHLLGRILGYGTVWIRGVGGGLEPLRWVGEPLALRNAIIVG